MKDENWNYIFWSSMFKHAKSYINLLQFLLGILSWFSNNENRMTEAYWDPDQSSKMKRFVKKNNDL